MGINDASIAPSEVLDNAGDLVSESGENYEYDRALVELTASILGFTSDQYYVVARAIGVHRGALHLFA